MTGIKLLFIIACFYGAFAYPVFAQKFSLIGGGGASLPPNVINAALVQSGQDTAVKIYTKSIATNGKIGVVADYGHFDIIGAYQYTATDFDTLDFGNIGRLQLKNSNYINHNITAGWRYKWRWGIFQPYLGAQLGVGIWESTFDIVNQTINGQNIINKQFYFTGHGHVISYGFNSGVKFNITPNFGVNIDYILDKGYGGRNVKAKYENAQAIDKIQFDGFTTHNFSLLASLKF